MPSDLNYDFHFVEAVHEERWPTQQDGGDGSTRECCSTVNEQGRALLSVLATPFVDCRRRSHPRTVPDYSVLVLVACLCNPPIGYVACAMHRRAKDLYVRGDRRAADVLYVAVMVLSLLGAGSAVAGVSLAAGYRLVHHFSAINVQRAKPQRDCFFRESDDLEMKRLNLTRNDYCRHKQEAQKNRGSWGRTKLFKTIDNTLQQIAPNTTEPVNATLTQEPNKRVEGHRNTSNTMDKLQQQRILNITDPSDPEPTHQETEEQESTNTSTIMD